MKKNNCFGFTLIETLVTLTTLGMMLIMVISTFMTVLTKSVKVRVVEAVDNDGKYALRVMEQIIRNSLRIISNSEGETCQSGMNYLRVQDSHGNWAEFACLNEGLADGFIASSSASSDKRLTSPKVKLDNCYFNCISGDLSQPDRVEIYFTLSQIESTSRVEERSSNEFHTSVILRNF
ncbi:MAG TPA: type II secretion system protein [Candidatus Bathyarchaeia archaeon]|nr:type II secretion system protein [Candidatus Bathyarchaeia archaeon]